MKGGVTSGIVYPPAAVALASRYTFRNIGGTSVGAIAAAFVAAAECGRRSRHGDPFTRLAQLRKELAHPGFLAGLFQPAPESAALFHLLFALMTAKGIFSGVLDVARAGLRTAVGATLLIAAVGGAWALWYTQLLPGSGRLYLLMGALGATIAITIAIACVAWQGSTALGRDAFGLCTGFDAASTAGAPRLTNWICALLSELSGVSDHPLTFGDLWDAPQDDDPQRAPRAINLEMIATNVTLGRPYRFPLEDADHHRFLVDPDELKDYFPPDVITWMTRHPATWQHQVVRYSDGKPLVPLPEMTDLPIVVATRLSLSFPILFRAVPLYAIDFSRKINQDVPPDAPQHAERCWFSDGGITSNFPIHFFDSPLPRWPTFAIDLGERHPEYNDPVWMSGERGGMLEQWTRFDAQASPRDRLFGFLGAILNTALGWRDVMQAHLPAFRDRIVHVALTAEQGGLNLNMTEAEIGALADYGTLAGSRLLDQFNFEHHVRARHWSAMCALQDTLGTFAHAYDQPVPQDETAWRAIRCEPGGTPIGTDEAQRAFACRETAALAEIGRRWQADREGFCTGAPHPRPQWRIVPRI